MPATQETAVPIKKLVVIPDEFDIRPGSLTMAAPKMIGVDSRNENRAAPALVNPMNIPVVIVIPEREPPGTMARTWDIPISRLVPKVIRFISIFFALLRSAQYRKTPINISMMAIKVGDLKTVSAFFSKRYPPIAPGILAATRYQNSRPSTLRTSLKPFIISRHQSFQK